MVLLIDTNENLERMGPLQTILTHTFQLIDPIRAIHQKPGTPLPPILLTGSYHVNIIFVSPSLQHIIQGGWKKLEDSIGDHQGLFIDRPI